MNNILISKKTLEYNHDYKTSCHEYALLHLSIVLLSITQTHQNIANFTHTRLAKHVALFATHINRTINQRKNRKKEIRVYKTGYRYLRLVTYVPNS